MLDGERLLGKEHISKVLGHSIKRYLNLQYLNYFLFCRTADMPILDCHPTYTECRHCTELLPAIPGIHRIDSIAKITS